MSKKTINSVQIQVNTTFRGDVSNIDSSSYLYNYRIRIQNFGEHPVQLLRRYWKIEHLNHGSSIVSGDGVVGEQPILKQFEF